ncbi:Central kinetochore-associated [Penicillium odoratum]|uniref:Central kinetochore-associated n=1 Tax=Penicillium odoratum TaxID=1167516 RepID=UPI0025465DF6|nr:Central kinetochore-associated [Penicillium odoratum]KAJ5752384.1 Central kinetochore-associated [Penicillium odoratum]
MANPLSPLRSSFQNARALSPKLGSSPFLTKTIEEQADSGLRVPSSPLKKAWTAPESSRPDIGYTNENYIPNDNDDFQDTDSSPFRDDAREDTVDFHKMQEFQQRTPSQSRHRFGMAPVEDPMSSPFRPDGKDETVDFQRLREIQPMSPGLSKRLAIDNPASSPFRPQGKDETVDFDRLCELRAESPGFDQESLDPDSSPLRPDPREQTIELDDLQEYESKRDSIGESESLPPVAHSSPFRPDAGDDTIDMQKLRPKARISLGMEISPSNAATPRKRSFDQTPYDHDDDKHTNERAKKGMLNRADGPDIHVDIDEESSIIHDQSLLSTISVTQDPSTIGNSMIEDKQNEGMSTVLHDGDEMADKENTDHSAGDNAMPSDDDCDAMDDTGLSNFSVLPDMTSFAKLRADSPLKSMRGSFGPSPGPSTDISRRSVDPATPGTGRRSHKAGALLDIDSPMGSPTPRRRVSRDVGNPNNTPSLLEFSDQMNFYPRHSMQQNSQYSPRRSPMRNVRQSMRSPSKLSLLDFDIPPAPTPRSIPTVTPRELESLKSGFMSEISSLKATLSGKEAEVACLKTAVGDAERRVGEALEEIRNEAARRETLEIEQAEWDRRGKDMERVLQSVRDELEEGERERDRLTRRAEEAEKRKEQLEGRVVELESQLSTARSSTSESTTAPGSRRASQSAEDTAREVQDAVEKVARELHTLYKGKHETKVAALKKSYEARWEKRLRESDNKLTAAREENERLKAERDAADSESIAAANVSMIARENDEHEAQKRVFEAQIQGLQQEMAVLKEDSERLRSELKTERAEKGELVAAVDEWLNIQQTQPAPAQQSERAASVSSAGVPEEDYQSASEAPVENFRRSVSRSGSSGIRPPSTTEKKSRFGAPASHSRGNSGGKSGIAVFTPGRGGIMSSIERMGRGGA